VSHPGEEVCGHFTIEVSARELFPARMYSSGWKSEIDYSPS